MTEENNGKSSGGSNTGTVILGIALIVILIILGIVLVLLFADDSGDSSTDGSQPPTEATLVPTLAPPVYVPTPAPGDPTAIVEARDGVNVRTGPGTLYPVIGIAPQGTTGIPVGTSGGGTWLAFVAPNSPTGVGWVSAEFVSCDGCEDLPFIPAPAPPTATPLPIPTATPAPDAQFTVNPSTVNAGGTVSLQWDVENIRAIWVYPVGANYQDYPVQGQGSRDVLPYVSTSYAMRIERLDGDFETQETRVTVLNGLTDFKWQMQSYADAGGQQVSAISGVEVSAFFNPNGSVSGSAGCNTYGGAYTAYESTLFVGGVSSSQMACAENIMQQEAAFINNIQRAASIKIDRGLMTIFDAAGNTLLVFNQG